MWVAGFSIDNISLMALAVSVGFVVDDAIVMIENCFRNLEKGMSPLRADHRGRAADRLHRALDQHLAGRGVHPAAVHGRAGRPAVPRILGDARLRHRHLDGGVAVAHADDLRAFRRKPPSPDATWLDRAVERVLRIAVHAYAREPRVVLRHRGAHAAGHCWRPWRSPSMLYVKTPKGFFPQDDTGLIFGGTRASTEISFKAM